MNYERGIRWFLFRQRLSDAAPYVIAGSAIVAILGFLGYAVWYEYSHPCLESRTVRTTCPGYYFCAAYNASGFCSAHVFMPAHECDQVECLKREGVP